MIESYIVNILPTKYSRMQNLGYIAKLNIEKTKILNIYLDRKSASTLNNYQTDSSLDNPVKNFSLSNICSDELKNNFMTISPILYKNGIGKYNNLGELIKEFSCKNECMWNKTLTKALDKELFYNNYRYKYLYAKLYI